MALQSMLIWLILLKHTTDSLLTMNTGYNLNRVDLTQDEQTCILKFLRDAQECGYPSSNEPWYPVINNIMRKYYDSDIKEAQVAW
jgi:hypothetical protein